jgi:hypothetical protein
MMIIINPSGEEGQTQQVLQIVYTSSASTIIPKIFHFFPFSFHIAKLFQDYQNGIEILPSGDPVLV